MLTQGNARLPGESFAAYRSRLKKEHMAIKNHLRGRLIYDCGVRFADKKMPDGTVRNIKINKGTPFRR